MIKHIEVAVTSPHAHTYISWYRATYALTPAVIVVVLLPASFDVWTHDSAQDPVQVLCGGPLAPFTKRNV